MTRVLTRNIDPVTGRPTAPDIGTYRARGGYEALRRAVPGIAPADVRAMVERSGLRGRGGAGFPTGLKWGFLPQGDQGRRRYLVCNCDEMEPGSFKDRLLLFGDPHQLLEGIIIAAWALQANECFVFVRAEYRDGAESLDRAIAEAMAEGLAGKDVNGSGFDCHVHVHLSAGRYICGEETALINAIEGHRPTPRSRPPYPAVEGLFGQPTCVNNVETLACVPHIVRNGPEWFRGLGRDGGAGTKVYTVSGRVRRPGAYELPIGVTLGELIHEHCGGMRDGYRLKAVIPGGGSTPFLTADQESVRLDFAPLEAAGSRLGTGGVIVVDDRCCVVGVLRNLEHFYAQESCGWCTPCREGLPYVEALLADLEAGRGTAGDIELLESLVPHIGPTSFCAHAAGAMGPLESGLRLFREEFEAHLSGGCPLAREAVAWPS